LLRDNLIAKDFNGRKNNYNNKTQPSEANQPKPQFNALTAIKPEATKTKTQIM